MSRELHDRGTVRELKAFAFSDRQPSDVRLLVDGHALDDETLLNTLGK